MAFFNEKIEYENNKCHCYNNLYTPSHDIHIRSSGSNPDLIYYVSVGFWLIWINWACKSHHLQTSSFTPVHTHIPYWSDVQSMLTKACSDVARCGRPLGPVDRIMRMPSMYNVACLTTYYNNYKSISCTQWSAPYASCFLQTSMIKQYTNILILVHSLVNAYFIRSPHTSPITFSK